MKQPKVICEKCNGFINSSEDLVTSMLFLPVVAYHDDCFVDQLKGRKGLILSGMPLNGTEFNVSTFIVAIIGIISLFFFNEIGYLFFLSLIPIGYRLYSYFIFEHPLKKLDKI